MNRSWLNPWVLGALSVTCVFLAPILAVFAAASGDSGGLWSHLIETVLPRYISNTLLLMFGVGFVSLIFGISSAWVVVRYEFPGRRLIEWVLLLPFAVPPYLIAYTYTDFFEYAGPLQVMLRSIFGWNNAGDYWFPEIRSMPGAMMVMGSVLYPYVYVMSRVAFVLTPASLYEVGIMSQKSLFWKIGLPLARPAIVAGLALVLMETISDFGTVEYFAIETLTLGIFNVWLGMNSLPTASQIASLSFLFIIALLVVEIIARSRRRFMDTTRRAKPLQPISLGRSSAALCWAVCLLPVILGFVIPVGILLSFVAENSHPGSMDIIGGAALNSLFISGVAAVLVISGAAFLGFVAIYKGNAALKQMVALASIGYAFPGTILAIGVVTIGGALDAGVANFLMEHFAISHQGWFTGGVGLVIFACVIRFQAIGYGAVTSGLERLSPNMMDASRVLGFGFGKSLIRVIIPLTSLSFVGGGLLVFVDSMKELPMALLLRPFNYETLATYVYQYAKDELLEEAALPALIIIAASIIPVIIMNFTLNKFIRR